MSSTRFDWPKGDSHVRTLSLEIAHFGVKQMAPHIKHPILLYSSPSPLARQSALYHISYEPELHTASDVDNVNIPSYPDGGMITSCSADSGQMEHRLQCSCGPVEVYLQL